jgi:E3 ubiquitin-protein ligase BRE1
VLPPQLTKLVGEKEQRISDLSTTQRSESDVMKLEGWESLSKRVEVLESTKIGLEAKLSETRDNWAQSRGDRESAVQSLDDQHAKFNKRWAELVHGFAPGSAGSENGDEDLGALLGERSAAQAREIVELEHKLSQALENVRQAESTRQALNDALTMNGSLQAKLDEIKAKYSALRTSTNALLQKGLAPAGPSAQNQNLVALSADTSSNDLAALSSTERTATQKDAAASSKEVNSNDPVHSNSHGHGGASNSSSSDNKLEKLHREHRRMRKELSAAVTSKETAKAKLEKIEKERDTLMESNFRLLKQMTEKDEMNAKSLSTILHLKSMTEELQKERDSLEQQAKSASQLALTARLASNAKDRVSEELMKEKEALEMKVEDLESSLAESKRRLDALSLEFAAESGKTSTLHSELSNSLNRCQELVGELEKKSAEIRTLTDTVSKSERETRDLTGKLQKLMKNPSGAGVGGAGGVGESSSTASAFTVDQLNTQISVLKGRLACPVCHYRDKECIIMRCRHMHCKQCVEERISNRSRKCPTCNNKFSDKDVEDVWLN